MFIEFCFGMIGRVDIEGLKSDVVFWFFDVGFFYHIEVEFGKCWIVYLLIGNVSWV